MSTEQPEEIQSEPIEQEEVRNIPFETVFLSHEAPPAELVGNLAIYAELGNWLDLTPVGRGGTFGNLSYRIKQDQINLGFDLKSQLADMIAARGDNPDDVVIDPFLITASGLVSKVDLSPEAFVLVLAINRTTNPPTVYAVGTRQPSSETLAHGFMYQASDQRTATAEREGSPPPERIGAIFHGHHKGITDSPLIPHAEVPTGEACSLDLALASEAVVADRPDDVCFIWTKHGPIAVGETMAIATERIVAAELTTLIEAGEYRRARVFLHRLYLYYLYLNQMGPNYKKIPSLIKRAIRSPLDTLRLFHVNQTGMPDEAFNEVMIEYLMEVADLVREGDLSGAGERLSNIILDRLASADSTFNAEILALKVFSFILSPWRTSVAYVRRDTHRPAIIGSRRAVEMVSSANQLNNRLNERICRLITDTIAMARPSSRN